MEYAFYYLDKNFSFPIALYLIYVDRSGEKTKERKAKIIRRTGPVGRSVGHVPEKGNQTVYLDGLRSFFSSFF